MAEFIPDYSDIVNLDDAEPLEGPDLVQYQTSIAEKVDEINRLGMPDNQPCNLIDYFDQNKDIKEKVERITMAVKEQDGVLYGCANLTLRENLTPEEYRIRSNESSEGNFLWDVYLKISVFTVRSC